LLTCEDAECSQPIWHPDGRRLLYEWREPPSFNRPQLWWLDTQTGETRLLLEKETGVSSNARFSPDGTWVSFAASPNEGLRLYNFVDGRSLTFPSDVGTPATWHPLGNQLLFQNSRSVVFHGENNDNHAEHSHDFAVGVSLYLVGTNNNSTSRLLSEDGAFNDGNAAWSPDGAWIAFGRRLAGTNTGRQLWLMRADGSEAHALTDDISLHFGPPSWSPDGRFLLFQQYDSNTPNLPPTVWLLEIATGEFIQVTTNGLLPTFLVSS
jgi:Tol biopolymer transport system component